MVESVENLIHERLRLIRAELGEKMDKVLSELRDLKLRDSEVRRDQAHQAETVARVQISIDQLSGRLDHIERRLELRDTQAVATVGRAYRRARQSPTPAAMIAASAPNSTPCEKVRNRNGALNGPIAAPKSRQVE